MNKLIFEEAEVQITGKFLEYNEARINGLSTEDQRIESVTRIVK
jgi:hypothetical protein